MTKIIILILMIFLIYGCVNNKDVLKQTSLEPKPTEFCSDGIIQDGETSENCCEDVGCEDGLVCFNYKCITTGKNVIAKYSKTDPIIDGLLDDDTWKYAIEYPLDFESLNIYDPGKPLNLKSFIKAKVLFDKQFLYMGLRIEDVAEDIGENSTPLHIPAKRGYDKIVIYFDEGSETKFGSGSRDYKLNLNQEEGIMVAGSNIHSEDLFWFNWTLKGEGLRPGWRGTKLNYPEDIKMKFHGDHWEVEFKKLLLQEEGIDEYDLSDLNINPEADYLGFTIYYMNNDGPEQPLPGYEEYAEYHVGIKDTIDWSKRVKTTRIRNGVAQPYYQAVKQYKVENWPTIVFDNYVGEI